MSPIISVIIPVYNTGKYLKKCLQSVVNQKVDNIEIIIVNDTSTDDSLKVIQKFVACDTRFSIIDKKINEGLEEARKSGVAVAKGRYLCHLDSDDWLPHNALRILLKYASENDADIVAGNMERVFDRFGIIKKTARTFSSQHLVIDNETFMRDYYINFFGVNIFPVSMCGKLYRTRYVKSIAINKLGFNLGEDLNYNIQMFPHAKKIVMIPDVVYCYRYGGMTSKFNCQLMPAAIKMYNLKRMMAANFNTVTYYKYINIELKNYLKTYIEMFFKFEPSSTEHRRQLGEILNLPELLELKEYYSLQETEGFEKAFSEGDIDGMCQYVRADYEKNIVRYKLIRTLSKLIT